MRDLFFFGMFTLFFYSLRSVTTCNCMYTNYTNYIRTFVVRTPYVTAVYKKIVCVLTVYALKSIIKYSKPYTIWMEFPRISRNVEIGKIVFSRKSREFPENPRKIP
jgi:hypothetical protein